MEENTASNQDHGFKVSLPSNSCGRETMVVSIVKYKDQIYCLTRLRFGLSSTPKIMTAVLKTVLTKEDAVKRATGTYINDILVEEAEVTAAKVRDHINTYGLTAKLSESSENKMALGWKLRQNNPGKLMFRRGN